MRPSVPFATAFIQYHKCTSDPIKCSVHGRLTSFLNRTKHNLAVLFTFHLFSLPGNRPISDQLQENPENYSQGESSGSSTRTAPIDLWEMWIRPAHHSFVTKRPLRRHFGPERLPQWLWPEGSVCKRHQRSELCVYAKYIKMTHMKSCRTGFQKVTLRYSAKHFDFTLGFVIFPAVISPVSPISPVSLPPSPTHSGKWC